MTHKKFWEWFSDPLGNLITDRGRFSLLQVDEIDRMPIREKLPDWLKNETKKNEPLELMKVEMPESMKKFFRPETFFEKVKRKYKAIIDLVVGVTDLFTKGAASKIENSIYKIFTDDTENENVIKNKQEGNAMLDTLKNFITGFVTRWILKIGGGFLLSVGVNEGSVTEIVTAVVAIVIGLAISLFQQKKALETDLKTLQH